MARSTFDARIISSWADSEAAIIKDGPSLSAVVVTFRAVFRARRETDAFEEEA